VMDALGTPDGWLGVRPDGLDAVAATIREFGEFRHRRDVEPDPAWKQIIPYPVLRDGDRTFLMRRTRAGGDARLHDHYSIGVRGHPNPGERHPRGGVRGACVE